MEQQVVVVYSPEVLVVEQVVCEFLQVNLLLPVLMFAQLVEQGQVGYLMEAVPKMQ